MIHPDPALGHSLRSCAVCDLDVMAEWIDLGPQPPANAMRDDPATPLTHHELRGTRCNRCGHVQLSYRVHPEILYADYTYRSSISRTFQQHCAALADWVMRTQHPRRVLDIGSNDGTMLAAFRQLGMAAADLVGVDPSAAPDPANVWGDVWPVRHFFPCALPHASYSVILTQNTLNAVEDLHGFVEAIARALAHRGVWIVEVPYFPELLHELRVDTLYHEHLHYWMVGPFRRLVEAHGLCVTGASLWPVCGMSVRFLVQHRDAETDDATADALAWWERCAGFDTPAPFEAFRFRLEDLRDAWWRFYHAHPGRWAGYGAVAKATVLAHLLDLQPGRLRYVVDDTPAKQGKWTASGFPVVPRTRLTEDPVDTLLCFPWNVAGEIKEVLRRDGHTQPLAVAIPSPRFV